jgi:hypothetical protein
LAAAAVERDRFGDRERAEPARIERVDLAGFTSSPTPETQVRVACA